MQVQSFVRQLLQGDRDGDVQAAPIQNADAAGRNAVSRSEEGQVDSSKSRAQPAALEEKRVRNYKMKAVLAVELQYPTYREGMSSIASGDIDPFIRQDLEWLNLSV